MLSHYNLFGLLKTYDLMLNIKTEMKFWTHYIYTDFHKENIKLFI